MITRNRVRPRMPARGRPSRTPRAPMPGRNPAQPGPAPMTPGRTPISGQPAGGRSSSRLRTGRINCWHADPPDDGPLPHDDAAPLRWQGPARV